MESQDAMEQMDRRVNLVGSELPAAKETQATEVLMVTPEMLANLVLLELMERRVMLDVLEDLVPLAHLERSDRRESWEVLDCLAILEKKETRETLEIQELQARSGEEETMG